MKWIWGILFLMSVAVAALLIARSEATRQSIVLRPFDSQDNLQDNAEQQMVSSRPKAAGLAMTGEGNVLALYGKVPVFSLTERSGNPFSNARLAGKPWIANFIFTSCSGQCPLMSLQMKKLQDFFPPDTGFRFVSFTVDPERDKPEVLSHYADRYGAEKDRWFFLTGPKGEINRILKGFFLSSVDQPAMHSIRFVLVDGEGQIRGYYDLSDEASMKQLIHDAHVITGIASPPQRSGGAASSPSANFGGSSQ